MQYLVYQSLHTVRWWCSRKTSLSTYKAIRHLASVYTPETKAVSLPIVSVERTDNQRSGRAWSWKVFKKFKNKYITVQQCNWKVVKNATEMQSCLLALTAAWLLKSQSSKNRKRSTLFWLCAKLWYSSIRVKQTSARAGQLIFNEYLTLAKQVLWKHLCSNDELPEKHLISCASFCTNDASQDCLACFSCPPIPNKHITFPGQFHARYGKKTQF